MGIVAELQDVEETADKDVVYVFDDIVDEVGDKEEEREGKDFTYDAEVGMVCRFPLARSPKGNNTNNRLQNNLPRKSPVVITIDGEKNGAYTGNDGRDEVGKRDDIEGEVLSENNVLDDACGVDDDCDKKETCERA